MIKGIYHKQINESLLDKGIKMIILAFNEQKNEFTQSISILKSEIKKLKDENYLYKNKLTLLQKKLNSLSKTVLLLDEETEESKNEENKKIMMQTLNTELKSKKNNNHISRNSNRVFMTKNLSMKTKINSPNDENKKQNNINKANLTNTCIKHKRPYTSNFKNLKYEKKNQIPYEQNKIANNLNSSDNISSNSELSNLKNLNCVGGDLNYFSNENSKIYKKLNLFLEKCKTELNALDYENILELFKTFENDSDANTRKKVKKIIKDKTNLKELFDDIFEE